MELHDAIQLRRGTGEVGCIGLQPQAGVITTFIAAGLVWYSANEEVVKLVRTCHGHAVQDGRTSRPSWSLIIRKHEKLIVGTTILEDVEGLAKVCCENLVTLHVHPHQALGDVLVLALPQQLSLPELVDAQILANAGQQPAFEGEEAQRDIIKRRRVNELQMVSLVVHVGLDGRFGCMSRVQRHVVNGADDETRLVCKLGEVANC
mmetsp:Transcript_68407/g.160408  ORF Transcript_68407/g.160408 Transcript_68407/m.160408 type:complete len:205 (-) Transcript_68407:2725-3339(-)